MLHLTLCPTKGIWSWWLPCWVLLTFFGPSCHPDSTYWYLKLKENQYSLQTWTQQQSLEPSKDPIPPENRLQQKWSKHSASTKACLQPCPHTVFICQACKCHFYAAADIHKNQRRHGAYANIMSTVSKHWWSRGLCWISQNKLSSFCNMNAAIVLRVCAWSLRERWCYDVISEAIPSGTNGNARAAFSAWFTLGWIWKWCRYVRLKRCFYHFKNCHRPL